MGGGLAACFAFALFAKQSKANESPSLPLPPSPKPLATYHLPLGCAAWSTWPATAATLPVVDVVGDIKCC